MVCTAAPNHSIASPLVVHPRTGFVTPIGKFFNIEGFLEDLRRIIDQNAVGFELIASVQTAMDSRFDPAVAPHELHSRGFVSTTRAMHCAR